MGFTINDTLDINNTGADNTGVHTTMKGSVSVRKQSDGTYICKGVCWHYVNKASRDDNKQDLSRTPFSCAFTLGDDPFATAYTHLKSSYTSTTDDL